MSKALSKTARAFLRYVEDQHLGRIDIGDIDGSTRPIETLVRAGFLRRDGHMVVITDEGREALRQ